ncbi:PIG-L family deacetylase [Engelhardtia mirabilis]|uniref:PIG-L family deacetylase n=1 Tax=Engelhardtia mirabilis TaxID=2528011 RepID=UPI003AF33340
MKPLFPPLADPSSLPRRVLCIAPHADDEVFGCGGMLAFHALRGDEVRVVVLTDGAAGDPGSKEADIRAARVAEDRAAGEALGVTDQRFLGLPDGTLGALPDLVARMSAELEAFEPELVYGPSPQEMHPDHRAASHALMAALARGPERRVLLYGVNNQVTAGVLFDTTAQWDAKVAAIRCFESQLRYHDLVGKAEAVDRARTVNIEDASVRFVEGFADLSSDDLATYEGRVGALLDSLFGAGHGLPSNAANPGPWSGNATSGQSVAARRGLPETTAVISTWNKVEDVCANLDAIRAQTLPFAEVVVVDNCSSDATVRTIRERYPEVRVVSMPHSAYGACETFNIGFACVTTELTAILDDDIVMPPEWLEKTTARLLKEPASTAIVSTKIVEPGMPESYKSSERVNTERYMSTFRGCASLARSAAIREAGYYDERLFIYGNERDLTCRLLNRGYRVLQYPGVETFHRTPFGIKMGKRSLYFHARNAWLTMFKYAPLGDLVRLPWLVLTRVLLRGSKSEAKGSVTDATGTIGIGRSIRETPGAWWVLVRAGWSVVVNIPYCLAHREPVRADDFELPLK